MVALVAFDDKRINQNDMVVCPAMFQSYIKSGAATNTIVHRQKKNVCLNLWIYLPAPVHRSSALAARVLIIPLSLPKSL